MDIASLVLGLILSILANLLTGPALRGLARVSRHFEKNLPLHCNQGYRPLLTERGVATQSERLSTFITAGACANVRVNARIFGDAR
jgi:hypothetical protein